MATDRNGTERKGSGLALAGRPWTAGVPPESQRGTLLYGSAVGTG